MARQLCGRGAEHAATRFACLLQVTLLSFVCAGATTAVCGDEPSPAKPSAFEPFPGHAEYVYEARFSPDHRFVVTASGDNTAQLRAARTLKTVHDLSHEAAVYAAAFSPDGLLIATGTGVGMVTLWNAKTGQVVIQKQAHHDAVYSVDFSPDGQHLATAGGSTDGGDTTVQIRDVATMQIVRRLSGHSRQVYGVTYSPDGTRVATSSSDRTIRIWNTTNDEYLELKGHTSDVYRCRFSASGLQLASTSQDGTVRIWNSNSGKLLTTLTTGKDPTYSVIFLPNKDGEQLLVAVGGDGHFRAWALNPSMQATPMADLNLVRSALYTVDVDSKQTTILVAGENGQLFRSSQVHATSE